MELKAVYFENKGEENTEQVFALARQRATELGIKTILIASTTGKTAVKAVEALKSSRVIIVTHATGFYDANVQEFSEESRRIMESSGVTILTTTHTFAGLSRALRNKYEMHSLGDFMADTLRIFGEGMKVACEISTMAADSGLVRVDEDIISLGGTMHGVDTAIVVKPANVHRFFELKVREIICKPRL